MADLGWLRYAAPDQVPGLREMDRRARPWREVPDVVRCGACRGALPPDTEAACSDCGIGTPPGLTVLQPLRAAGSPSAWATFPYPPERVAAVTIDLREGSPVGPPSTGLTATMPWPGDVEDWEGGDVALTLKRRPWWLRWWNR